MKSTKSSSTGIILLTMFSSATLLAQSMPSHNADTATEQTQATYKAKCEMCHGPDAKGSDMGKALKAKDLTSQDVQKVSDDELRHTIVTGKGNMPPFGQALDSQTIDALLRYVRSLAASPAKEVQ